MRIIRPKDVEAEAISADKAGNPAKKTSMQVLVPEGPNFIMRVFTVKPGGHTPRHEHDFEHQIYVLNGKGRLSGVMDADLAPGDAVYVQSGDLHSFENVGDEPFSFICVIPSGAG